MIPKRQSRCCDATAIGLRDWQKELGDKLARIQRGQKSGQSSCLMDAKIALCESLVSFANPDQSPEGFAETFAKVQATEDTFCDAEGYGDLDNRDRWGLDNAREAIKFGAMAHLCASVYGLGAPIYHSPTTVALADSYFDVGSEIPGVSHLIVSEPESKANPTGVEDPWNR
jgi:hypothetical protein